LVKLYPKSATNVLLEVSVLPPGEHMLRAFLKRLKYWLIKRQTPVEKGDAFLIPYNILLEFNTRTYYSRETPTVKVIETTPEGNIRISVKTHVSVNFKPSGPSPVIIIKVSENEPPLEKHSLWSEFLKESTFTLESYQTLDIRLKDELCYAFRLWLAKKGLDKEYS